MRLLVALLVLGSSIVAGQALGGVLRRRSPGRERPRVVARSDALEAALRAAEAEDPGERSAAWAAVPADERRTPWGRLVEALAARDVARLDAVAAEGDDSPAAARAAIEALRLVEARAGRDAARRAAFVRRWPASWWTAAQARRDATGAAR